MRSKRLILGLTVLVCTAGFAQSPSTGNSNSQQTAATSVKTARETGSGMATGKRTATETNHLEQKNIVHRDLAARQASTDTHVSGDPHENSARETGSGMATGRREAGSGMASGKRQHAPAQANNDGTGAEKHQSSMSGAQSNPIYKDDGKSGTNPLYEGKDSRVQSGLNSAGSAVASGAAVVKTKTKSNQSNDRSTPPAQPVPPQSKKD